MVDDYASTRERIIESLFRKVNANGDLEDTYVTHIKVWEEVPPGADRFSEAEGMKARYIMISVSASGQGTIHKGKANTNGSFSIGKKWHLDDLKGIEVVHASALNMTIGRTYKWRTEREQDMTRFATAAVHLHQRLFPGKTLNVAGIQVPPAPPISRQPRSGREDNSERESPSLPPVIPTRRSRLEEERNSVATSSTMSSVPAVPALRRPTARPTSSSSYGSAPGSFPRTSSSGQLPPAHSRSRTPVGSALRSSSTSAATAAPTRSPKSSVVISLNQNQEEMPQIIPPLPRAEHTGSRSQTPQPPSLALPENEATNHTPTRGASPVPSLSRQPRSLPPPEALLEAPKREANARISFFDPSNQAVADRLLVAPATSSLGDLNAQEDDYGVEATMTNVEEMIDGFEWNAIQVELAPDSALRSKAAIGRKRARGAADQIEARLQDELMALEKANIHSFLESDDRVLAVIKLIDDGVHVLDDMDALISGYKTQLNAVSDDISFIQSRDRGLQVQTQNQHALVKEIEQLLSTVHVDPEALVVLTQGSLKPDGIESLEYAAAELYKAMQAAKETDMAASMERLDEYRTHNSQFTTRLVDYLSVMFSAQATQIEKSAEPVRKGRQVPPVLAPHGKMEDYIGRYSGLILYIREMDENKYSKICGTYYSVASELHAKEMRELMNAYLDLSKRAIEDGEDFVAFSPNSASRINPQIKRAGTVGRAPLEGRKDKDKSQSTLVASEAFGRVLGQITPQIYREENFIADFLQINDSSITFADYIGLESYFRRQAARSLEVGQATAKLVRGAMDLIFGFLPEALKVWIDGALIKDNLQLVGIMSNLEKFTIDAEERGNVFVQKLLQKQSQRMLTLFNRLVDEQVKAIEQTKLTTKKRKGVAHFIKYFPIFASKIESQLVGADSLEVRGSVDGAYEQIVQVMFESLQQMAKMDGAEAQGTEDKGLLNYHVILIENMHHFVAETSQQELGAIQSFLRRAEAIYDENLSAYVKQVVRRPMGKILDYFEGVERLLKTTAPSEVHNNGPYSKSSLKKVLKEYGSKEVRRYVEALHKRVDKHFALFAEGVGTGGMEEGIAASAGAGRVVAGVWKACEEEMVKNTETFARLIEQCYDGTGLTLEYTVGDVQLYFRKNNTF